MTRDELGTLLIATQRDLNLLRGIGAESNIERILIADEVVRKLWPVLAQAWDEGANAERQDLYAPRAINPYREVDQ